MMAPSFSPSKLALYLQRPAVILPLCGLIVLAAHSVLYPSSLSTSLRLDSLSEAVDHFHLLRPLQPSLTSSDNVLPSTSQLACNPYSQPGSLQLNLTDPWLSTYTPFPPSPCPSPPNNLLHSLILGHPAPSTTHATILLIGDSVDRELVRFFHHAGKLLPLKPVPLLSTSSMDDSALPIPNNANNGYPKLVSFPQFGLEVRNYHFCGLDREGAWPDKQNPCNDPAPLEPRWEAFERWYTTLPRQPEVVVVQSSLWDIARFQRELYWSDLSSGSQETDGFSPEWLEQWVREMRSFVRRVRALVGPGVKVAYRLMHETTPTEGTWFKPPGATKDVLGPTFSILRVHQIRQAQRFVAETEGVELLPLGEVLAGQKGWLRDDIHPGIPGNAVYAEMVLELLERMRRP